MTILEYLMALLTLACVLAVAWVAAWCYYKWMEELWDNKRYWMMVWGITFVLAWLTAPLFLLPYAHVWFAP